MTAATIPKGSTKGVPKGSTKGVPKGSAKGIPPGSIIGILGGGQLGRMTALAASRLGYKTHVFCQDPDEPGAQVAAATTLAPFTDRSALTDFARSIQVATFEFENIPLAPVRDLARLVAVRPGPRALEIAQDRLKEKDFVTAQGIATTAYGGVGSEAELGAALASIGTPAVLKTVRLGYDGKGQVKIDAAIRPEQAWRALGAEIGILEAFVDFEREISVIVARGVDGRTESYVPVENRHVHHILDTTIAPADLPSATASQARAIAETLAHALDLVGLLAVEMFVAGDGRLLVNELAPRPHNSGHWTIDACLTSQFEQLVRAICGLPLGSPERHSDAVMTNLIGDQAGRWPEILADPTAKLHLYGKREARPGRKMGHVTRLRPRSDR